MGKTVELAFTIVLTGLLSPLTPGQGMRTYPEGVDAKIEASIARGLGYLVRSQDRDGSWGEGTGYGRYPVAMTALALDDTDTIEGVAANTTGTVLVLPEGDVQGGVAVTVTAMRLVGKDYTVPYDGAVEWSLSFNSVTAATYGTNDTT